MSVAEWEAGGGGGGGGGGGRTSRKNMLGTTKPDLLSMIWVHNLCHNLYYSYSLILLQAGLSFCFCF